VQSFDDSAARAVPGVREVVQIPNGVAVLADHFWAAHKGREALSIQWNAGPNQGFSTSALRNDMLANMDGQNQVNTGNAVQVVAAAPTVQQLDVTYELPYLAHAPMEPLNAVADVRPNEAEVWVGSQVPNGVVGMAANLGGVPQQNVTVHVPLLGGGFGRRATNDFVEDAIRASAAVGRPVKVIYTREDDMRSAQYRPMAVNRLRGAVDGEGWPSAWVHNIVGQQPFPGAGTEGAGNTNYPYGIPNRTVTFRDPGVNIDVFTWRSVGSSLNGFVVESFLDELAALGGKDPLELRQRLIEQGNDGVAQRYLDVLNDVTQRADWAGTPPAGRARGLAIHRTFGSIVGQVAEVSVGAGGQVRVHRVWASVDCGRAVNPRGVAAQCEGSIIFGLTAAFYGQIDIDQGRPVQGNFNTYRLMRMSEAPDIDVNVLPSTAAPSGMGEPGVPPAAPAVTNAIFRLTGQRVRRLPIVLET
jgi:isoquinoline 1-oxidoreductase beta subunit